MQLRKAGVPRSLPQPRSPTPSWVPGSRCHDAAALLRRGLHAAAVAVVAEAEAVTYLVGHGGCSANGELRVVGAHASRALGVAHALDGCQTHGGALEGAAPEGEVRRDRAGQESGPPSWDRVRVGGTHVSSCAESWGRRAHSSRRH